MNATNAHIIYAIVYALSGQKLIIKDLGGGDYTIVKVPEFDKKRKPTKAQQKVRNRFTAAASYAKKVLADPELEKIYKEKATQVRSAFNLACMDYLNSPVVKMIDTTKYTGMPGTNIVIKAKDNFQIKSVEVKIFDEEGNLIEKGKANIDPVFKLNWDYTSTKQNARLKGSKIKAIAIDLAGNKGELEITL